MLLHVLCVKKKTNKKSKSITGIEGQVNVPVAGRCLHESFSLQKWEVIKHSDEEDRLQN